RFAAFSWCLASLIIIAVHSAASIPGKESAPVHIRTGSHSAFLRIVIEGAQSLISQGTVEQNGSDVIISFRGSPFRSEEKELPGYCRIDGKALRCAPGYRGTIKSFTLGNPDRFVVDIYRGTVAEKKETSPEVPPATKKEEPEQVRDVEDGQYRPPLAQAESGAPIRLERKRDEKDFIPEQYRAMWTLLETGNFYAVIKELPSFRPGDRVSLAAYYYLSARASLMAKQYRDAAKYMRLAYIYAEDNLFRERILMARADTYMRMGLYYEAQADYIVFLLDYPSSEFIEAAHFGMAKCLASIGQYRDAVEHYEKAGGHPEVLFGKADALQRLDRASEAKDVYARAMALDRTYPDSSPETYYLMGENMRMTGNIYSAKIHFARIESGPFYHNALISAGLIALEQGIFDDAIKKFRGAAASPVQKVRVQALFNMSLAYARQGAFTEAVVNLEEIRHDHINSSMYRDTLLVLSKLYKKEGRMDRTVSLLKELVYGSHPPAEAFEELEKIVLERLMNPAGDDSLLKIWAEVGPWLTDPQREDFLLKVAYGLRNEGKPYIELCLWLIDNGSLSARGWAAARLAGYYTAVGNEELARKYITAAHGFGERGDEVLRAESKMLLAEGRPADALKNILQIKKINGDDLEVLNTVIAAAAEPGSQEVKDAVDFYEHRMIEGRWNAEQYSALADLLYDRREFRKSLTYYRMALNREPGNQWVLYRMARVAEMPESQELFSRLEKQDSLLGNLARSKLLELALTERVKEVY
ncbi:MAG: hypothetical protein JSU90_04345, partial [Nitrospiraceae bacterium]